MFMMYALFLSLAHANALTIDGNTAERTFACEGRDVTIQGNDLAITLNGDCGVVKAVGNNNVLTVDGVKRAEAQGNNNVVNWKRNLSGATKLPVAKIGVGNKIKQVK
jgi:hypothetical protein